MSVRFKSDIGVISGTSLAKKLSTKDLQTSYAQLFSKIIHSEQTNLEKFIQDQVPATQVSLSHFPRNVPDFCVGIAEVIEFALEAAAVAGGYMAAEAMEAMEAVSLAPDAFSNRTAVSAEQVKQMKSNPSIETLLELSR